MQMAWTQATPALYHFGSRNKEYFTVQLNARITHANPQLEWTVTGRRNDAVERKFQIVGKRLAFGPHVLYSMGG